jgi:hypothetical protein
LSLLRALKVVNQLIYDIGLFVDVRMEAADLICLLVRGEVLHLGGYTVCSWFIGMLESTGLYRVCCRTERLHPEVGPFQESQFEGRPRKAFHGQAKQARDLHDQGTDHEVGNDGPCDDNACAASQYAGIMTPRLSATSPLPR